MLNSDGWLFIGTAVFFVGTFGAVQIAGWRAKRTIVGGTRGFAQVVMVGGLVATAVLALLGSTVNFDLQVFRGWPFIVLYTLSILSPFLVPAMLAIELVLLVELFLAKQASRSVWLWHIGAFLSCTAWVAVGVLASNLESKG